MTRFTTVLGATALALAFSATTILAQTTTAPGTPPAKTTTAKKSPAMKAPTTEIGKKCSADADAAGLHGKKRSAFRAKCKRDAAKT